MSRVIELENSLNQYEGVCSMAVQRLPVGSVCAAQFSENSSWYRGCVLEVEGHESKIRFLDYGNVEWVMNHLVQPIHPGLLEVWEIGGMGVCGIKFSSFPSFHSKPYVLHLA